VTGFVLVNAQFILSTIESTKQVAIELRPFFRLFPAFNVGDGLIKLGTSFYAKEILGLDSSPFDWDVAGAPICFLFVLSVPYFVLLLILEYSGDGGSGGFVGYALRKVQEYLSDMQLKWNGIRRNAEGELLLDDGLDIDADEDEDVIIEKKRVIQNEAVLRKSAKILIVNLWKVYPPSVSKFGQSFMQCLRCAWCCCCCQGKVAENRKSDTSTLPKRALRGVTLAIESGETFGLLGVNGAGKTTAMAILTGDTPASMGQVYVAGYDVTGHTPQGVSEARKHIGFCPQIDPLLDLMTGRETLRMFAGLRGIPPGQLDATVDHLLNALTLTPHSDKAAGTYSGGNKRKLSLGISLIGEPDVLLIDEASSGMDPAARRKIWDLISQIADNRLVVLTTHSMEEAEALCTRLTILVGGKMKCIGSVQHLKSKYLGGYTLDLQLQSPATLEAVKRHVIEIGLPFALLKEEHGLFLRFSIPSLSSNGVTLSLGSVFSALESMKNDISLMVREYSLAQSTLEEVFINFARDDDQGFGATNT
jgi:ATP-binding cassette subfamily A (ABC1) protein 3